MIQSSFCWGSWWTWKVQHDCRWLNSWTASPNHSIMAQSTGAGDDSPYLLISVSDTTCAGTCSCWNLDRFGGSAGNWHVMTLGTMVFVPWFLCLLAAFQASRRSGGRGGAPEEEERSCQGDGTCGLQPQPINCRVVKVAGECERLGSWPSSCWACGELL